MPQVIEMRELIKHQTFTLQKSKSFSFSNQLITTNGQAVRVNEFIIDGQVELIIRCYVSGIWKPLRKGQTGYLFVPQSKSPYKWEVIVI